MANKYSWAGAWNSNKIGLLEDVINNSTAKVTIRSRHLEFVNRFWKTKLKADPTCRNSYNLKDHRLAQIWDLHIQCQKNDTVKKRIIKFLAELKNLEPIND